MDASGAVISRASPSRRTSPRGISSVGQPSSTLKARSEPSSASDTRCELLGLQSVPAMPPPEATRNVPPCRLPRTRCCPTHSRDLGASTLGQSDLNVSADMVPILPSKRVCMAPAMSETSPWADTSAPPARSANWLSTMRARSGEKEPRARQSSMVMRWWMGGSAPSQPPADLMS